MSYFSKGIPVVRILPKALAKMSLHQCHIFPAKYFLILLYYQRRGCKGTMKADAIAQDGLFGDWKSETTDESEEMRVKANPRLKRERDPKMRDE